DRPVVYFVFDRLHQDGRDLTGLPLVERKARVARVLVHTSGPIRYSEHIEVYGESFFTKACKAGLEGIVSNRVDLQRSGIRSFRRWPRFRRTGRASTQRVWIGRTDTHPGALRRFAGLRSERHPRRERHLSALKHAQRRDFESLVDGKERRT